MNLFVWSSCILNSVVLFEFNVSMKCTIIISKWWIQCLFFFLCNKAPDVLLYTIGRRELCMHQKILGLVNKIFWNYMAKQCYQSNKSNFEFIEIYIFKDLTGGFDLKMQFKFCLNFVQSFNRYLIKFLWFDLLAVLFILFQTQNVYQAVHEA